MRRKSERNKAKTTAEKKVEKPTRRTRRRGRGASPSASPENTEGTVSSVPYSDEEQEQPAEQQETTEQQEAITSSDLIKSVLTGDEEDNGSVWKVSRADASPGEIQKLKLCRQRNISEASDSSVSKKLSNKWPDSGEGGTEEVDSVDEQATSSQEMLICEQADDSSSLHPTGQDSNQEVSDYTENLPETTSANLSDDKTNIDQQAVCGENETSSTNTFEAPINEDSQSTSTSIILAGNDSNAMQVPDNGEPTKEATLQNVSTSQQSKDNLETSKEPACLDAPDAQSTELTETNKIHDVNGGIPSKENVQNDEITVQESVVSDNIENKDVEKSQETESTVEKERTSQEKTESVEASSEANNTDLIENKKKGKVDDDEEEGEIREEKGKERSSESDESDTRKSRRSQRKTVRSTRRNHDRYRKSSSSDTSDNEKETENEKPDRNEEAESVKTEEKIRRNRKERKNRNSSESINEVDENSISVNLEPELELSESNIEKEDILEIPEKPDDLNVSMPVSKPAKVSLKRSFSSRVSTDIEVKKEEAVVEKSTTSETSQNKENHADNTQSDQKSSTKRRRWGVTTTTDAAPAYSISTDSLKALVPGAKPLSENEVKLSKDEDEEREHRKSKSESQKPKSDSKNEHKKGEEKIDNQAASRRKIIIKETPRPTSPSLPEAQATNILLIKNLVRPFTLNQIKELLSRTGTIVENGFWMDRIKSKCFVEYTNEDQAFETRQALHGVSWPPSNPKKLAVEYATKEDMEAARETTKEQPVVRKAEPVVTNDLWQQDQWNREDKNNVVNKITVIREWDLGKEDGQLSTKDKEKERRELEKKKRARSRSPALEVHLPPPARKFKKKEEEPPTAKLLDDLFRKTKATPCIYWLPLTNEQILVKEEMRRQHMAEHARRMEEMRRAERSRDSRRRRSPRK